MAKSLIVSLAAACLLAAPLGGCMALDPRAPIPVAAMDDVRPTGYGRIRSWGDSLSPDMRAAVTRQYQEVRQAAAGKPSETLQHADFLAISGGGSDGAYAAGFLKGWSESGTRPTFEVVTGVSTGALVAPFAFLGAAYDGALAEIYETHDDADLYSSNGPMALIASSLRDTAPLKRLIEHYITDAMLADIAAQGRLGRRLLVQTTNLDAQRPVIWDLTAVADSAQPDRRDLFVRLLLASSAIPAVFPPQHIAVTAPDGRVYDELHVDGGTSSQIFFAPPALRLGDFEKPVFGHTRTRILYAIRNGKIGPEYQIVEERTLPIANRAISTLIKAQSLADLEGLARTAHDHHAGFFYTAVPSSFAAVGASDFDPIYMRRLYDVGRMAAKGGSWTNASRSAAL